MGHPIAGSCERFGDAPKEWGEAAYIVLYQPDEGFDWTPIRGVCERSLAGIEDYLRGDYAKWREFLVIDARTGKLVARFLREGDPQVVPAIPVVYLGAVEGGE